MAKTKPIRYESFEQISGRLDEIIAMVRDKNTSLERSLDLFDEALELGSAAVDLVDTTQFSPAEEARLAGLTAEAAASVASGGRADAGSDDMSSPSRPASEQEGAAEKTAQGPDE